MASIDGICEECGNTGLVGELCSFCGHRIEPLDKDLDRFEDEVPIVPKAAKTTRSSFDSDMDELELDDDLNDLDDDLDEMNEADETSDGPSIETMADEENEREDKEAWFDPDNFNVDEEEEH